MGDAVLSVGLSKQQGEHEERNSHRQSTEGEDFKAQLKLFACMHTPGRVSQVCACPIAYSVI